MNAVSCEICEAYDILTGQCDKDQQQHGPDDACPQWEKPIRRNALTGKPWAEQEVAGPPERK